MNAEFVEKMLQAKRLEAQAMALLVPPELRGIAAVAVRTCSEALLETLDAPPSSSQSAAPGTRANGTDASSRRASRFGMQSIPVE